jgi:hypothetical protein
MGVGPASSFLLLLSCFFFPPSFFARHPVERSDEGSLFPHNSQQLPAASKSLSALWQSRFLVRARIYPRRKCLKFNAASAAERRFSWLPHRV